MLPRITHTVPAISNANYPQPTNLKQWFLRFYNYVSQPAERNEEREQISRYILNFLPQTLNQTQNNNEPHHNKLNKIPVIVRSAIKSN